MTFTPVPRRRAGGLRSALAGLLIAVGAGGMAIASPYHLETGDVIEFSVLGIADLRQRAPISVDGTVFLPLVGAVEAAGRTLDDLRSAIAERAAQRGFPVKGGGGGDVWHFVHPEAVVLQVLEYRPIYLNGDVENPGAQMFRAGMTVRQAVAVAGGYGLARLRMTNPVLELADLKTKHNATRTRLDAMQTRIARLEAEIEGRGEIRFASADAQAAAPAGFLAQHRRLEAEHLSARVDDHDKEKRSIRLAIEETDRRFDLLMKRQQNEQTATEEDTSEYARVKQMYERGLTPITRLNDARRIILLWSTRSLETFAESARMERERSDLRRNLVRVQDAYRMNMLGELQAARLEAANLAEELRGHTEKLVYVGALRSALARDGAAGPPDITVIRKGGRGVERIAANEDTELLPGDVVDVALGIGWMMGTELSSIPAPRPLP